MTKGETIEFEMTVPEEEGWSADDDEWLESLPGYVGVEVLVLYEKGPEEKWGYKEGKRSKYILELPSYHEDGWKRVYFNSRQALHQAVRLWEEKREKEKAEAKRLELEWEREEKRREKWRKVIETKWKVNILNKWIVGFPEYLRAYGNQIVLCVSCGNLLIVGNPDDIPFKEVVNIPRSNYTAEEKAVNKIIKCCDKPDYHYYNPWDTLREPCMD